MQQLLRRAVTATCFLTIFILFFNKPVFADVTLTTQTVAAANLQQNSTNNIVYVVKMDVTLTPVTISGVQYTLGGTFDNNDLTVTNIWFNATAPSLTGATGLTGGAATFAAPHAFNFPSFAVNPTIAAGASGYFIFTVNVAPAATTGNTVKLNGATNPVVFTYTTSPVVTNNQTDLGGLQTILAATVTLSTVSVAPSSVLQGTSNVITYILKVDVANAPVQLSTMQFTLGGTFDNNDLTSYSVYYNTAPNLTGVSGIGSGGAAFAAPHSILLSGSQVFNVGTAYVIIVVNLSPTATAGNTIKVDGAANPVTISFLTSPTITNNQTDLGGVQTITAATVSLSSIAVPAANVLQGTSSTVVYILKLDVAGFAVQLSNVQFTLGGTYDNNDLTGVNVYSNTSPSFPGASFLGSGGSGFAAPHVYNIAVNQVMNVGSTWYILVVVNLSGTANAGNTIKIDGAANPVVATFFTGPTITNNQTDAAGVQTIVAPSVTLSSSPVAASNVQQGATAVITSITKVDVTGFPVTVNSIQYTLGGTYDNNDLTNTAVYYNATTPSLTGAVLLNSSGAGFAAPHTFNVSFSQLIAAGASGYFISTVDIAAAGTTGNTIKLNAATNPVVLGYTTGPAVTNNQTDVFGTKTILAAGVTLSSPAVSSGNITQGSANNVLYVLKVDVTNLPVTVNAYQFVVGGTYDNDDLTTVGLWYNASAPSLSGATFLTSNSAGFAAPHTYNFGFGQLINAGATGYFIFTASLSPTATAGNTVLMDGAANPVVLTFATVPPVTNNQTNSAGVQTITGVLPLRLLSFTGNAYQQQSQLQWVTTDEINTKNFEVEWSVNGVDFSSVGVIPSDHSSSANKTYSFVHKTPDEGINYYRLKMIDLDGHYTYSAIVKINMRFTATLVTVYPNPVTDIAVLRIQAEQNSTLQLKLLATDGSLLQTKTVTLNKGNNRFEWNMQQLPRGVYTIAATNQSIIPVHVVRN